MSLSIRGPIARRKISQEVTDRLLKDIESGRLRPGDRLPSERELMDFYGVGRPAVREALQSLANMGLVQISHGERARVCAVGAGEMLDQIDRTARMILAAQPETLEHLKEARLMFEVGMAKIAAARAGDSDIAKLRGHVDALEANLSNPAKFLDEDMAFHTQIAAISGNAICAVISQAMLRWLREFRSELVAVPGRELVTIAEHRRILAGIESRDPAAAEAAMTAHLTRAGSVYRSPAAAG